MNETIHLGITLMIVTLIAGAALALTNYFTAPLIESQQQGVIKESLSKVITADSFKQGEGYSTAYDSKGNSVGKVLSVAAKGYSSVINAVVGIDNEGKITGIEVISQQETPGLGAKIVESSFLNQFIGKSPEDVVINKDGGKIDAITGATISSRAITNGVRQAIEQNIGINPANTNDTPLVVPNMNNTDSITGATPWINSTDDITGATPYSNQSTQTTNAVSSSERDDKEERDDDYGDEEDD
ncbi:MAG: RnfABCDGE type electron transport complex subunit G [Nanoarchaeota archaeon]|nr:RnfABCDGE type electron transport complex subunit G [Nanoarchaeota archaeon]